MCNFVILLILNIVCDVIHDIFNKQVNVIFKFDDKSCLHCKLTKGGSQKVGVIIRPHPSVWTDK